MSLNPFRFAKSGATRQEAVIANGIQSHASAAASGQWVDVSGVNGAITFEIQNNNTGTAIIIFEGTLDRADFATDLSPILNVQVAALGSGGALTPVVGNQNVSAGVIGTPSLLFFSVLTSVPTVRCRVVSVVAPVDISVRAYLIPQ